LLPKRFDTLVVNYTIVRALSGIRMAAFTDERFLWTANQRPAAFLKKGNDKATDDYSSC
jgi:hypothetical protein